MVTSRLCRCSVQRAIGLSDVIGYNQCFIITVTNFPYLLVETESQRTSLETEVPAMLNSNTYVHLGHIDPEAHEVLLSDTLKHEMKQAVRSVI